MLGFLFAEWFFVLGIFALIVLSFAAETLNIGLGVIVTVIFAAIAGWLHPEVFTYIKNNPEKIVLWTLAYLAAGIVWSGVKWAMHVRKVGQKCSEIIEANKGNMNAMISALKSASESYAFTGANPAELIPKASKHKDRIIIWMVYWIPSFIGTICNEWVYNLFNNIFKLIRHLYQSLANQIFSGVIKNYREVKNAPPMDKV